MKLIYFFLVLYIACQDALSNVLPTGTRIIGGTPIQITKTPYQVLITVSHNGQVQLCGGSLVRPNLVLTAAHCMFFRVGVSAKPENVKVDAGFTYFDDSNKKSSNASWVIIHEKYSSANNYYDIALIKLKSAFELSDSINVIGLSGLDVAQGTTCSVSGWGSLYAGGPPSNQLQFATVPIYNRTKCVLDYYYSFNYVIPSNTLCAGFETGGVDFCKGDNGGPLVCNNLLAGIASFGYQCGHPYFPGVYTDISKYKIWIEMNSL